MKYYDEIFKENRWESRGARDSVVVEALCYKPEGRGIASRLGGFFFFCNLPNPSGRTMALGVDSASNRNEYQES
jgi:hypothetical protein